MGFQKIMRKRAARRALRVKNSLVNKSCLPRIAVFRSLSHIYAQLIDDIARKTIASCSSLQLKSVSGTKREIALAVGRELAERAKQNGIESAVFDRGSFLYHGRVKSLADGLREGGLKI